MNILITGGNGFLGKELVKQLNQLNKHKLFIVSRKDFESEKSNIKFIKADITQNINELRKIIAKNKINVVYHLAASSDESLCYDELYKINTQGTKNIILASINNNVNLFVHISTSGVLGDNMGSLVKPANETFKLGPQTNYEKTKYLAEQFVIKHKKDIPIVIIRPTMIYGPNNNWIKILKKAKKRFPLIGKGENIWHLVYVVDVAAALVLVLNNKKAIGQTYIIAGPDYKTYKQTYEIICKCLNVRSPNLQIPIWFANAVGFLCEAKAKFTKTKPIINRSHIKRLLRNRVFDCTKARQDLGFVGYHNLEMGIKETVEQLK